MIRDLNILLAWKIRLIYSDRRRTIKEEAKSHTLCMWTIMAALKYKLKE